ncbi:IS3 family transposase [Defluviitalea raffinosedens]|uniref:IS3 family transposase n=1 Tax=Defluviitalea raffinosedens TaxID=1450156 RepID=UPI001957D473|nr:hypothetical protein [Defluviitalea raffinosedens]
MIKANTHKYSVSAMCKVLRILRSTYYYEAKAKPDKTRLTVTIIDIFKASRNNYDTRKIKVKLKERGIIASCRIGKIMKQEGLVSNYTISSILPMEEYLNMENIYNRNFNQ